MSVISKELSDDDAVDKTSCFLFVSIQKNGRKFC